MNAQEQAHHYYKTAFDRWALELSHEKNHLIAKSIASYVVEQILEAVQSNAANDTSWVYWEEVLTEINKIRGYEYNTINCSTKINQ